MAIVSDRVRVGFAMVRDRISWSSSSNSLSSAVSISCRTDSLRVMGITVRLFYPW